MRDLIKIVEAQSLMELTPFKGSDEFSTFKSLQTDVDSQEYAAMHPLTTTAALLGKFTEYLKSKGYVSFGKGAFGTVFTHPGLNYAIKIFRNDPAYLAFVRYALANQDNPHLPRFRGRFMKIDDRHYVVRIEMLKPLPHRDWTVLTTAFQDYQETQLDPDEYLGKAHQFLDRDLEAAFGVVSKQLDLDNDADTQFELDQEYEKLMAMLTGSKEHVSEYIFANDPQMLRTLSELFGISARSKFRFDLHAANMMLRADGCIVITDPFASFD